MKAPLGAAWPTCFFTTSTGGSNRKRSMNDANNATKRDLLVGRWMKMQPEPWEWSSHLWISNFKKIYKFIFERGKLRGSSSFFYSTSAYQDPTPVPLFWRVCLWCVDRSRRRVRRASKVYETVTASNQSHASVRARQLNRTITMTFSPPSPTPLPLSIVCHMGEWWCRFSYNITPFSWREKMLSLEGSCYGTNR